MNAAQKGRRAEQRARALLEAAQTGDRAAVTVGMAKRRSSAVARNATPQERRNPNDLHTKAKPGQTPVQARAALAVGGVVPTAITLRQWSSQVFGEEGLDLTAAVEAVVNASVRVKQGNLGELEMLLTSQVLAMNAIFANLASRAKAATYMDHLDRYMRLALKAQGQCRATIETLAMMKNPPVFARQANIASGPQQVNNGPVLNSSPARAELSESAPNKLLEAHGQRLDTGAPSAPGTRDQTLAPVGTVDGTADAGGKGAGLPQSLPRRGTSDVSGPSTGTQRGPAKPA